MVGNHEQWQCLGEKGRIFDVASADLVTSRKKMSRHVAVARCYKYEKSHWI